MKENWIHWIPIKNIGKYHSIQRIVDDEERFFVNLLDLNSLREVHVIFEHSVGTYRVSRESYRIKLIEDLHKQYGENFYGDWTFFKVNNSELIQWMQKEATGTIDDMPFIHFAFLSDNICLDVVTTYEPKIIMK